MSDVQISCLSSGVRIVSHSMPHVATTAFGMWFETGSRHEEQQEHGIAHFLEHMLFKGTKRRTAHQIAVEVDAMGGEMNGSTGDETTGYYLRTMPEDLDAAVDILTDMILHSSFQEEELEKERGVVIQEIGASEDRPDEMVFEAAQRLAFGTNPLGRPVIGTRESVRGFDANVLKRFHQRRYVGPACVVAAAGNVDHDALCDSFSKRLAPLENHPVVDPDPAFVSGGERRIDKDTDQVYLVMNFPASSVYSEDFYLTHVLANILGGGWSSRLFQEVREKRGLCYAISTFFSAYRDTGIFGVFAATGADTVQSLLETTVVELKKIGSGGVDQVELNRVRAKFRLALMASHESPSGRADQLARQLLTFDRIIDRREVLEKIEAVTCDQLTNLARSMFENPELGIAALGPIDQLPEREAILSQF